MEANDCSGWCCEQRRNQTMLEHCSVDDPPPRDHRAGSQEMIEAGKATLDEISANMVRPMSVQTNLNADKNTLA